MAIKAPCLNCTDRSMGCHGKCEKYQSFVKQSKEHNENVRKLKNAEGHALWDAICHSHHAKLGNNHKT